MPTQEERITALERRMTELTDNQNMQYTALSQVMGAQGRDIKALRADVSTLRAEVSELDARLSGRLDNITGQLALILQKLEGK